MFDSYLVDVLVWNKPREFAKLTLDLAIVVFFTIICTEKVFKISLVILTTPVNKWSTVGLCYEHTE